MRVRARRVLVVANPAAGLKRGRNAGEAAAAGAKRAGAAVELHRTAQPGEASEVARAAARDGIDLVLAAGGDGTAHEVAQGLAGTATALGVAPAGTMNLLARVLAIPLDAAAAAEALVRGSERIVTRPGRADGRLFVVTAGAGFDAWVLRALLRSVRVKIGFGDYVRGALRGLATFRFDTLRVVTDAGTFEGHTIVVGRAPLYGGFLRPTPGVAVDEGPLEMCALRGGRLRLAATIPYLWSGAHDGRPGAQVVRVVRAHVTSDAPDVPYQLDGELAGVLPVTIDRAEARLVLARL
jgi:YegS/Rv2252/BmrU family lipid kinase